MRKLEGEPGPLEVASLNLGAVRIDFVEPDQAAKAIVSGRVRGPVNLCSAHPVALANDQRDLAEALNSSTVNFPDGMPLVWFARRAGLELNDRVYGPKLMEDVLDLGRENDTRHYFYGSTPEVLASLTSSIENRWPGTDIAGTEAPPFRDLSDDEIAETVARAAELEADIVWVGMGVPKQVLIADQMSATGDATYIAIGAAFDFIAGTKSQAPSWMQRLGLEWLFRLVTEPRRLWRRYFIYNTKFLWILWRSRKLNDGGPVSRVI